MPDRKGRTGCSHLPSGHCMGRKKHNSKPDLGRAYSPLHHYQQGRESRLGAEKLNNKTAGSSMFPRSNMENMHAALID